MAESDEDMDDLKKLPPAERIKKLRELEEKRKKEIEEAEELIKQSEGEIEEEVQRKRDIPIDQVKQEITDDLTGDAKLIFETKRFRSGRASSPKVNDEEAEEDSENVELKGEDKKDKKIISLEDELLEGERDIEKRFGGEQHQYQLLLARAPIDELNGRLGDIYRAVQDKGYLNDQEQQDIYNIQQAMYKKAEDAKEGSYATSEDLGEKLDNTKQMIKKLIGDYDSVNKYSP